MGILIHNPGMLTTVQDEGRHGFQQYGVSISGAVDRRSLRLANLLVGNTHNEAALEVTIMGPNIEFLHDIAIAITGGDLSPMINGKPIEMYRALKVKNGDVLSFGMCKSGCRAYISFAGGLDVPLIMGSRSTYIKAGIGGYKGRQLKKGDMIQFYAPSADLIFMENRYIKPEDFSSKEKVLRVVLGPQDDCFTDKGISTFLSKPYKVTNEFDRMGCRLEGEVIEHVHDGNIISDGISFGAIQVPSSGQPIIMLSDRQTTGGYTKIANVITADLPIIAQSKVGDIIRFEQMDVEQAQDLYLFQMREYERIYKSFKNPELYRRDHVSTPGFPKDAKPWMIKEYDMTLNGKSYHFKAEYLD